MSIYQTPAPPKNFSKQDEETRILWGHRRGTAFHVHIRVFLQVCAKTIFKNQPQKKIPDRNRRTRAIANKKSSLLKDVVHDCSGER